MPATSEPQSVALENDVIPRDCRSGAPSPEPVAEYEGGRVMRHFSGAPARPAAESTARLLRSPRLSHSANHGVRADALQRAQQTFGNQFVQRAIASAQNPQSVGAGIIPGGSGEPMDESTRMLMESRFDADFGDVRVHTDAQANASAENLSANAFTSGRDVYFARGQYAPTSSDGRHLLAHELTHTIQQRQGREPAIISQLSQDGLPVGSPEDPLEGEAEKVADNVARFDWGSSALGRKGTPNPEGAPIRRSIQRAPPGGFPGDQPVSDAPPFVDEATLIEPGKSDHDVTVAAPVLVSPSTLSGQVQLHLKVHTPVFKQEDISLYAVPITKIQLPKSPAPPPAPVTTGSSGTVAPTSSPTAASNPQAPVGSVVTTLDGVKLEVLASTPEHVITAKYTKFAVGAASTSALRLMDGTVVVIDAGINNRGLGTTYKDLADTTMRKLAEFIKDDPIREILISHTHKDHTSLVLEIMRRFRVDIIRINDIQKRWPGYKALRAEIVKIQEAKYRQTEIALRKEIEAERSAWEEANAHPDKGILQERWEKHAAEELQKRMAEVPRLKERNLIPSKGGVLDVVDVDVRTGETSTPDEFKAEDPIEIRETMREPTDPDALRRRWNTKTKDIDPNASAYLIQLPSGLRFLVMPDIRADDMEALTNRFADEVRQLHPKEPVTVQIWDATHHMQIGWSGQGIKATQLRKIVDFLSMFQMKEGADAVVVSAQADFSRPDARTLVDPVNIWLLRSLGFEVYLASSARDVTFFEITTTQGTKLAGTPATSAPGSAPGELSMKRAKMALDELKADKLTREAALADETDPVRQKYIREAIAELDGKITQIDTALNNYIEAGHKALAAPHGSQTTRSLAQAPEPAIAERNALDTILERWNFDRPIASDLHLTEMAMVVLRQEVNLANPVPGSPAARALELKTVRSRINELGAQIARGGAPEAVTAELFAELTKYKSILTNELHPGDPNQKPLPEGVTRKLLEDDLKSVEAKIETLEGERKAGSIERAVGSGEIIETHVVAGQKPAQESTALRTTRGVVDAAGKGLGAVMVIQTIRGQGELMKRWEEGRANNAEVLLSTTHNVGAAATGVKMVRGIHVGNGVFVVLTLLDVGAALAHDYDSDEQRNVEVTYAVISSALNLGLMVVGQALMKIPNPIAMIAGLIITFAARPILEALGVHEWLERKYGFNPSDVIQVYQTLRKLVDEYSIIVGSILLADRTASGLEDLSVSDPTALREQARIAARDHRIAAIPLERRILGEFKTAYDDAKGNYAGLKVLDQYREQFITLQRQANPHDEEIAAWHEVYDPQRAKLKQQTAQGQELSNKMPSGFGVAPSTFQAVEEMTNLEPQPTGKLVEKTFAEIESGMTLDQMSADEIRNMHQWDRLREAISSLVAEVDKGASGLDNDEIRKKDKEARLMIENARYRLDPRSQGEFRSKGLFSPNSPAKAVYEEVLEKYERSLALAHERYIETAMKLCGAPLLAQSLGETQLGAEYRLVTNKLSAESMIRMVEVAVTRYKATVESMMAPPESLVLALFTNSADAQTYEQFVNANPYYAGELKRVEMVDATINGLIDQAWSIARPDPAVKEESAEIKRLKEAVAKKRQADEVRFHKRGIIFASELRGLAAQVKEAEIAELAPLLGEKPGTQQLNQEEIAAIQSDQMESIREGMVPPISNRLRQIPALRRIDANGTLTNIHQLYGPIKIGSGGKWIETAKFKYVKNEDNVVVGAIGPGENWEATTDYPERPTVRVIPLNDAAMKVFERYEWHDVLRSSLEPLTKKELEAMMLKK